MFGREDWRKHPRYLADFGGLFGAPSRLKCQGCKKNDYELSYGHCVACAEKKGIPRQYMGSPQTAHDALAAGTTVAVQDPPKRWYPWWHWRRWFG